MKIALCSLLVILILVSARYSSQDVAFSSAMDVPEKDFKLGWKLPVGDLKSTAVSRDGTRILLSALFDGYYLYDSNGRIIWRIPDPYAGFGEFSADGKSVLLTDCYSQAGKQKVSLVDATSLHEIWNYTLDRVDYARLSPGGMRTVVVGALHLATGGWQKLMLVVERNGTGLLNLKFGQSGEYLEFDESSQPAISWDGRYVAIGTWGREERDYWLYFADLDSGKSWNMTVHNGVRFVAMSSNATLVAAATSSALIAGPRTLDVFDRNGKLLWSASPDRPIVGDFPLWDFWKFLRVTDSGQYVALAGVGSVEGGYAALFDRNGKKLWDFRTVPRLEAFAMDEEASRFVVGDSDGGVCVLDGSGNALSGTALVSEVLSVGLGGKPPLIVAVGDENVAHVMDARANVLWTHVEIGFEFGLFDVKTSTDSTRILVGYPHGSTILDDNGNRIFTFNTRLSDGDTSPPPSSLTSDGRFLVVAGAKFSERYVWKPVLVWFGVDGGRQVRNVTLGQYEMVESLSMSDNGSLLAVSGYVTDHYSFIYALDSQGRRLWEHVDQRREPYLLVHSQMAVSGNGLYVAASRSETGIFGGGTNNGVVLFNGDGSVVWNYTTPESARNVAVSNDGYVAAETCCQLYVFDREGRLLWSIPGESGAVMISKTGGFVAGKSGGRLFLADVRGPYWQMDIDGHVESVAISDNGNVTAAIISRDYPNARTARLLYVMNAKGSLLANYTFVAPTQETGGSRVAVSGNGRRIVAALKTDGIYYFELSKIETEAATASTTSETQAAAISTSPASQTRSRTVSTPTTTPGTGEIESTPTVATVLVAGGLGFLTLLIVMKYWRRGKIRGDGERTS